MLSAYLGIDLGGSNIYGVVFDESNRAIAEHKIDTEAKEGYKHVVSRLSTQIQRLSKETLDKDYKIEAIGLGVPGIVSKGTDLVKIAPNLNWHNVRPLRDLASSLGTSVKSYLVNDVNAGLIGELSILPNPPEVALAYFCGTGVGGAVAINGNLILGSDGGAGEVGHMVVRSGGRPCGCGRRGCLEAYAGKWALNRKIERAIESGKKTILRDNIDYNLKKTPIKSSTLKKAFEKNDKFTRDLLQDYYCKYLAIGISQSVNLLSPDIVILGGGIMESLGMHLLPHIHKRLGDHCINTPPKLRLAELGDFAGPLGAALLAKRI